MTKAIQKIAGEGVSVKICYESTYSGFHLCRALRADGFECSVIAAGLIPELSGDRVKTDRLDAMKLARYFAKGLLTEVHVPEFEDEADRTLVRSRSYLMEQLKSLKRHMVSLSKQLGWHYRNDEGDGATYWTIKHRHWLRQKIKSAPAAIQMNFGILFAQLEAMEGHVDEFAKKIRELAESKKYKERVQSLICYRGISELTAMVILTEIGDIRRFPHPRNLVSYMGMDISEYSSGGTERRFSMTKMGNGHLRKIFTEAVQSAPKLPILSRELRKRRENIGAEQKQIADRCMKRLHAKATRLLYKSKPMNKVKSACAREMVGFIWESLNSVA